MIDDLKLNAMTERNRIPDSVNSVHLIAVCGTGMGALAGMLKDLGYAVTGSDSGVYPPMSDFLAEKGIRVFERFDPANLAYGPDLVVVGNAVVRQNPEAEALADSDIPFCSMPQALNRFAAEGKQSLLVTGTHGKTTTSSILAWTLHEAGLSPSFFVGGILNNFNSNYRIGDGPYIAIEGDEYDTAFFDKGPKFLHFAPRATIMTGVEFDHADIYRDLDHMKQAFELLVKGLPENSLLVAADSDAIDDILHTPLCRIVRYGRRPDSYWRLGDIRSEPPLTRFEVLKSGKLYGSFTTRMAGEYNLMNALAVIAAADDIGVPKDRTAKALQTFQGVKRRQEIRGVENEITVIDDFAHHPTAVRETVSAMKQLPADGRLIAVFEPRTNTSMRKVFQDAYPECFDPADLVIIRKPSRLDKIPEDERFSSEKLVEDLKRQGKSAFHFSDTDTIIHFLTNNAKPGDVILIMSNGGFDNIHERLLDSL